MSALRNMMNKRIQSQKGFKCFCFAVVLAVGATLASAQVSNRIFFDFVDGGEFDKPGGIGARMTRSNITICTMDLIGQDGTRNSTDASHETDIKASVNSLGINDDSNPLNIVSNEARDFNPGEGWVISFDQSVQLVEIDLASQDAGSEFTISSPAFAPIVLVDGVNDGDVHSLRSTFVPAGTTITFQMTAATGPDKGLRIDSLTVIPKQKEETLGLITSFFIATLLVRRSSDSTFNS